MDLAKYQKCGNSFARHIWEALRLEGTTRDNGALAPISEDAKWMLMTIETTVGINRRTLISLYEYINKENRLRVGGPKTQEQCRQRFLSMILKPEPLKAKAISEMAEASASYLTNGVPDFKKTCEGLQVFWEAYYDRGAMTPASAPIGPHSALKQLAKAAVAAMPVSILRSGGLTAGVRTIGMVWAPFG